MPLAPGILGATVSVREILVEIVAMTVGDGFREAQPLIGPFPSGAPAMFIDQCGKVGGSAALVGAVGDDDFGRVNTDRLRADRADVSAVVVDPEYPTGSAFVRYRADGSRDFVFSIARSAAARFGSSDAVSALMNRAGHLHVMGLALSMPSAVEAIEKAAAVVEARGGTQSLDPNIRKELRLGQATETRFAALVDQADLLLPSGEELERAAGGAGEADAVARLLGLGAPEIVLKRGPRGATAFLADGTRCEAAAFEVEEIDPTGAGDCFGGAYVAYRRHGMDLQRALDYASAAGARNVTFRGPMEGVGTLGQLDASMAETPRR